MHSKALGQVTTTQSEQSIAISKEVERFLRLQTSQLSNDIEIGVKPIDSRLKLQRCDELVGEISNQAPGVILSIDNAIGKTMQSGYPAGVSLRADMFKLIPIIQQGQSIKIISQGAGFRVSNDAIALNNASEGQITKAKTQSGVLVSGIARSGGFIEVQ